MSPHPWQRAISAFRPRDGRRAAATRRGRRPIVEPLESRRLLSSIADVPTPTANSNPYWMAAGPDGNLWFTEIIANKVGMINPTTHATADVAIPSANSDPVGITAGPDGNLWFTEYNTDKIASIGPASHTITEFTVPTPSALPFGITAGPDGNLWFVEQNGSKVGMIDPTTHAITEFAIPTPNAQPFGIAAGLDGNLWFTEYGGNKVASINPSTHAFVETPLPTANSGVFGIAAGPDGNLWFTEAATGKIGSINPVTRGIEETAITTAAPGPRGIAAGPDGNLWFAESTGEKIGVAMPTLTLSETAGPPPFVAPNSSFGLTVSVSYRSGLPDTAFNGNVTLALAYGPAGATLGGTLTVAAKDGVATFTGLSINQAGSGYRIMAYTDPTTTTLSAPVTVATPPTIVAEKLIYAGKGRHKRVVAVELDFSAAMDPARAATAADYTVTQLAGHGRQLVTQAVALQAAYDATAHAVTLTLAGKATFARGGKLVVSGMPPAGLTSAAGVPLDGGGMGTIGDDGTFVIAPRGKGISR